MILPNTAQDLFNLTRSQWIEGARDVAIKMLQDKYIITIEDVLTMYPRPKYIHRNTTGRVFRHEAFNAVGYTTAKKPSSHKRVIRQWTLNEKYLIKSEREY